MATPICPHCGEALEVVLDLPYGYWAWAGDHYELRHTNTTVDVAPWACRSCLHDLREFHPQDFHPESEAEGAVTA